MLLVDCFVPLCVTADGGHQGSSWFSTECQLERRIAGTGASIGYFVLSVNCVVLS